MLCLADYSHEEGEAMLSLGSSKQVGLDKRFCQLKFKESEKWRVGGM